MKKKYRCGCWRFACCFLAGCGKENEAGSLSGQPDGKLCAGTRDLKLMVYLTFSIADYVFLEKQPDENGE